MSEPSQEPSRMSRMRAGVSRWRNTRRGTKTLKAAYAQAARDVKRMDPAVRERIGRANMTRADLQMLADTNIGRQFRPDTVRPRRPGAGGLGGRPGAAGRDIRGADQESVPAVGQPGFALAKYPAGDEGAQGGVHPSRAGRETDGSGGPGGDRAVDGDEGGSAGVRTRSYGPGVPT